MFNSKVVIYQDFIINEINETFPNLRLAQSYANDLKAEIITIYVITEEYTLPVAKKVNEEWFYYG